ncbi:putative quinol monooxygenase [Desulfotalea psychrophila]|uniref:ABM domain-containing protein n=1 Tax=Desulfotalea psychrophila (strain LSv54 / DSM 12343) TaxID=177439 RepID=Q6ARE9_DESPS|nr:putative quinol monooxygenase [Desulfotalea psychrophila]CAG35075.1 hypothetical protein DP0346 [Desulfotalea psychrophila LSv54]
MITVLASITVKDGSMEEFLRIFKENVSAVLAEEGCIEYYPAIDTRTDLPPQIYQENTVTIIEKWQSLAALKAHLATAHMLAYKEATASMLETLSLKILENA